MRNKTPSISYIAKSLNISVTTVSFILNNKAEENRISSALIKKVLKFAKDIDYVPNHVARSLRTGNTNILGLVVEDIANPFFANLASAIEEIANKNGYRIFYCSSKNQTEKTIELITLFEERKVDGYIITPVEGIESKIQSLLKHKSKLVLFDRFFPEIDTSYVVVDNEQAAYNATTHLLERGYKNIAFITIHSTQTQMLSRLEGYKKALKQKNIPPIIKKVRFNEKHEMMVAEIVSFLRTKEKLDAVFFATNYLGVSGLEAINSLGINIPAQLGVISFDDHDLFRLHQPSITAVSQPIKKMSEILITILVQLLKDDSLQNQHVIVPAQLEVRNSTPYRPS